MYLKLTNDTITYPYSLYQLKSDHPQTSFPNDIPESTLNEFNVYTVTEVEKPVAGIDKTVTEGTPVLENNEWKQTWIVSDATYEEQLERVLTLRANSYPPMSDYLDGVVKNDQQQIQKYIDDCQAVKAAYPKPIKDTL